MKRSAHRGVPQPRPGTLAALGLAVCVGARPALARQQADPPAQPATTTPAAQHQPDPAAAAPETGPSDALLDEAEDSLDLMFEDFDVVVSASRTEQNINLTAVPVSIIDADEIHASGARTIPDLLLRVPGVDVLRHDNNRWSIGVRGLHQTFSDRTLFLVNGQNASSALHGGVDFQRLPVMLADIDRIEVVRGPGGGAWGANAFNGVVNVIEKSPRDTVGFLASQRLDEHGTSVSTFRAGVAKDALAVRLTGEFEDIDASDARFVNDGTVLAPTHSRDFMRSRKFSLDAVYGDPDDLALSMSVGHAHVERGDAPFLNLMLGEDERIDYTNASLKLEKQFDNNADLMVQWYGAFEDADRPSMYRLSSTDNSIDAQYGVDLGDHHRLLAGATLRWVNIDVHGDRATDGVTPGRYDEQWLGGFIGDRWTIDDAWSVEGQLRADYYSGTKTDWAGRLALLRRLDGEGDHVLRIAAARSFRTPQVALRELATERVPLGGGLYGLTLYPAGDLKNEQLYSLEAGYTGKLSDNLTLRVDGYAQQYEDLTGALRLTEPPPMVGRAFYTLVNAGGAEAFGIETEAVYETERLKLSMWYALNQFRADRQRQDVRAFLPARNKAGVSLQGRLAENLTGMASYRYTDTTPSNFSAPADPSSQLDLTLTATIPGTRAELQVGVLDLFDDTASLVVDQTADGIGQETRGRSAFFNLTVRF